MREILIFAGTTEGRTLSESLAKAEIPHTICVATGYGELVLEPNPFVTIHRGRMNQEEIKKFLLSIKPLAVVDATHPFATEITASIQSALKEINKPGTEIPYLRLNRENIAQNESAPYHVKFFSTNEACAKALEETTGNILLTTGSKELPSYCISEHVKSRLYVRVLPSPESLSLCAKQGICGKHVIAMQGPFSMELNEAIIRQFHISCLVTKETGKTGGYQEKLEAAKKTGTQVFVIACPQETEGDSFVDICHKLEELCEKKISTKDHMETLPAHSSFHKEQNCKMEIILAGIGMGNESCLTKEAEQAITDADILLGAKRLLEHVSAKAKKLPYYQPEQILPYLHNLQKEETSDKKITVLFSGDSGCYSGCQSLYTALEKEIEEKRLQASVHILPGISSVSYLSACIGESYQDAAIYSIHGKKLHNLAHRIQHSPKTFLLTSGVLDVNWLGKMLLDAGLTQCEITTGYRLSYEGQRVEKHTPLECCELKEEGLYTCFIKNPSASKKRLTHGMPDQEFIRDKVPMTKEEVREVSICKLRLEEGAILYDIGSGTGSIAVEAAALSHDIKVYAIEHKKEAIALIEKNKGKNGLQNITILEGMAPEVLSGLPAATHAFIGGSSGKLKEILETLRQINPNMRIVINAISMETICEIKEILSMDKIKEKETVQLQVNRVREVGNYHLMQSENPVFICAFDFCE